MYSTPNYILDFVIPVGATGPTGPTGISSIAYTNFQNTSTAGILQFANPQILPADSDTFRTNNHRITLHTVGFYEFTISGVLRDSSPSNSSIAIQIEDNGTQSDFLVITLQNEEEIYFSQTKILSITVAQDVAVVLRKSNGSNASIENVSLIIKKFPY